MTVDRLTHAQIAKLRKHARDILLDESLNKCEKIGYLIAMSRVNRRLGCSAFSNGVLKDMLYVDWDLLIRGL